MLRQIADFREEARQLYGLLDTLRDEDWQQPTLFKGWTVNDVVQHLHFGDIMAATSATDPEAFAALRADVAAKRATGLTPAAYARGVRARKAEAALSHASVTDAVYVAGYGAPSRFYAGATCCNAGTGRLTVCATCSRRATLPTG